ncbi:7720_t:CDS:2 [Funneliformis caledonium]|uniref:7720_t:CDS:1 n=1 Tax=Funneliformis caledonium TaxID=1117310 RepID=A0A9N9AMY6_9GLOM|nr:7720_t:CDS:2 [Funneliformis caledonium]
MDLITTIVVIIRHPLVMLMRVRVRNLVKGYKKKEKRGTTILDEKNSLRNQELIYYNYGSQARKRHKNKPYDQASGSGTKADDGEVY